MGKRGFVLVLLILTAVFSINLIQSVSALSCTPDWECSSWSSCDDGEMQRDCWDNNDCGMTFNKPSEIKYCHDYDRNDCDRYNYYHRYNHRCCNRNNVYANGYMAEADQMYQDMLNYYNANAQQQQGPDYQIIIVPESNNQQQDSFFTNSNWQTIALITISLLIIFVIILIIVLVVRR